MPSLLPFLLSLLLLFLLLIMHNCDPLTCPATATAAIIINYSSCDSASAVVQESQSTVLSCPVLSPLTADWQSGLYIFPSLSFSLLYPFNITEAVFFLVGPFAYTADRSACLTRVHSLPRHSLLKFWWWVRGSPGLIVFFLLHLMCTLNLVL